MKKVALSAAMLVLAGCATAEESAKTLELRDEAAKYYCRTVEEEGKSWLILKSSASDFLSASGKYYLIVNASVGGGQIEPKDRITIQSISGGLKIDHSRSGSPLMTANLTLDASGLWASGENSTKTGDYFVYRLPDAGTKGGAAKCRNGSAATCKTLHFEYYEKGKFPSHRPVWGGNVVEVDDPAECIAGPGQTDDGDGDLGP